MMFAPKAAWQNFWRNKGLSVFAVSVMTVVLMMVGVALVLGHSFNQTINGLKAKASTISVFMADSTPLSNIENLELKLRADPRVRSVTFVSKARALDRFKQDPNIEPTMIEALEGYNPLPSALDVDVRDIKDLDAVANDVKALPLLDKQGATNYRKDVIDKVVTFSRFVAAAGVAILVGLTGIAIFIIMMSIRTAVWFVRGPFLLEGMLAGLLASLIAVAVVAGGYHPLVDRVRAGVPFLPLSYDVNFIGQLCLVMAGVGITLGALGSYLGVRRFLQA
jgi:cell division transport system permease protein